MSGLVGRTIGNYVVRREVGRGGMGTVYLAEHPRLGRRVAVKVLHPEMSREPDIVARFFNEARAASDIHNANIVDILDFGELPDGTSYIVMEWLEGRSLADVLASEGKLAPARAAHVAAGVGRALVAAHAHGVIHRDLKPDNIFLTPRDDDPEFVKVLDFGIAKLLVQDPAGGTVPRTATNVVMGTPAYMSPEQCRGESSTLDGRSDIYSLGVILYEMVTGKRPFNAETYTGILVAHLVTQPPPPRSIDPSLPAGAERAILKALEKERDGRYARVSELVNDFAAAVGAPGITVPAGAPLPSTKIEKAAPIAIEPTDVVRPRRSRRGLLVGGAAAGFVIAGAVAWTVLQRSNPRPVEQPVAPAPVAAPPAPPPPPPAKIVEAPPPRPAPAPAPLVAPVEPKPAPRPERHAAAPKHTPPSKPPIAPPPPPSRPAAVIPPPPPPRPAAPVEERGDDLDRRLAAEAARLAPGQKRVGPKLRGEGDDGEGQDRLIDLEGGRCYTFVSVGSDTMPKLYTYLWEPSGRRLADHRSGTTTSTFTACAPVTGQYKFQAKPAHGPGQFRTAIYLAR